MSMNLFFPGTVVRAAGAALAGCAVMFTVTAAPAQAHAQLVESDPTDGDTVAEPPAEAVLTFSETLDEPSTQVALSQGDSRVAAPEAEIEGEQIIQPLTLPEAGEYTLSYRIVSEDGHPVDGSITFTTEKGDGSTAAPQQDKPEAREAEESTDNAGVSWATVGGIAAGVALIVGAGVLWWKLRRGD